MGGDHGIPTTIPASVEFLALCPANTVLLVGQEPKIRQALEQALASKGGQSALGSRIEILHTDEVVLMDDPPAVALRAKRQSSMRLAIEAVKEGRAHAAVSAGNTGALMAIARYVLKTIEGIDRPAIATALPNKTGGVTTMLDLGANVDCTAEHLCQFALMGAALVTVIHEKEKPSIGLLNVGAEVIKGNDTVKLAGEMLRESRLNFYGNVEGNDIFKGTVDIVVCDGFVGNVALKASEGVASMVIGGLKNEFSRNIVTKAAAIIAYPVLKALMKRMDYRRYNGAALLGLRGLVFKSQGSADVLAFEQALNRAYDAARNNLLDRVRTRIAHAAPLLAPADAQAKTGVSATTH